MEQQQDKAPRYAQDIIHTTAHTWQTCDISQLAAGLSGFQAALAKVAIKKDGDASYFAGGKNHTRHYLTLDGILAAVRPLLASNGLSVVQSLAGDFVCTLIIHTSGQQLGTLTPFAAIDDAKKSVLQNIGAGLTYLRRYALCAALGISADADDDGASNTASAPAENPQGLPLIPYNRQAYDKAALVLLKDGTLAEVEKKVYIDAGAKVAIYKLALEMSQAATAAEAANEQK